LVRTRRTGDPDRHGRKRIHRRPWRCRLSGARRSRQRRAPQVGRDSVCRQQRLGPHRVFFCWAGGREGPLCRHRRARFDHVRGPDKRGWACYGRRRGSRRASHLGVRARNDGQDLGRRTTALEGAGRGCVYRLDARGVEFAFALAPVRRTEEGTTTCSATLAGKPLQALRQSFSDGQASCSWRLPKRAHGQRLRGRILVALDEGLSAER
jgi:hypothetical protein